MNDEHQHHGSSGPGGAVALCPQCAAATLGPDRPSGVEAAPDGEQTVVRLWGEIDESMRAEASIAMALTMVGSGRVVLDTAGVEFIDSSGLAFVLQLVRGVMQDGRAVVVRDPSELVLDLLDLVGLRAHVALEFSAR